MMRCLNLAVLFLVACGPGKDDAAGEIEPLTKSQYLAEYPGVYCTFQERCFPDTIDDIYAGSVQVCVEDITTWARERLNDSDCSFGGEAAAECVAELPDAACEDWSNDVFKDSCGEIIDC